MGLIEENQNRGERCVEGIRGKKETQRHATLLLTFSEPLQITNQCYNVKDLKYAYIKLLSSTTTTPTNHGYTG